MRLITTTLLFLCALSVKASDFYWVGGDGSWTDFANHWATTSGGSTFHDTIPTANDNVFFDENSFDSSGTVDLSNDEFAPVQCHDLDASGLDEDLALITQMSFVTYILVYGDLHLPSSFGVNSWPGIHIDAICAGETLIDIKTNYLSNITFHSSDGERYEVRLISDLQSDDCNFSFGDNLVFHTDGYETNLRHLGFSDSTTFDATNSTVKASTLSFMPTTEVLDDGATFETSLFIPRGVHVRSVLLKSDIVSQISSNSSVDSLFVDSPYLRLNDGTTHDVTYLHVASSVDEVVSISRRLDEANPTLNFIGDQFCGDYLELENVNATGVTPYAGENSTDLGGNDGWVFSSCVTTSVDDLENGDVVVFPSTTTGIVRVKTEQAYSYGRVLTFAGESLIEFHDTDRLDLTSLTPGVYLIQLDFPKGLITKRVVKL